MRRRVFSHTNSADVFTKSWTSADGSTSYTPVTYTSSRNLDIMLDVSTPNFKKEQGEGKLFFKPMYREKLSYTQELPETASTGVAGDDTSTGIGTIIIPNESFYSWLDEIDTTSLDDMLDRYSSTKDTAVAEAFARVDQTELLAAATVGELPETVKWIASILKRFIKLLKIVISKKTKVTLLRKLGKMKAADYTDALSDIWLEFRYAVRPLIFEMSQAVKAFEKTVVEGKRFTARGSADMKSTFQNDFDVEVGDFVVAHCRRYERVTGTVRAGVLYTIDIDVNGIGLTFGLGSPFETIWELTPFSFILDWFLNVGDIISAWEKNASLIVQGAWVTEEYLFKSSQVLLSVDNTLDELDWDTFTVDVNSPGQQEVERMVQRRTIDPSRPIFPSFKLNLDMTKILDLAAIGRGLLKSFRSK